ncbi:zf-HC2 domain-containing protein [Paenibacillus methanolicus]|uniref:Putative zinc finger protein n=1 Tax=Paenibacillus methanolicus TaxID=582686 RepID=A0A5S5C5D6_9BACL|nr:zf-HC2 domain-containing protein [Paenibacillus methanolicus]TYP74645.1 putative zinc finger protein [Paenibacillus methanolicus]
MKRISCEIIQDLLPLYHDEVCSTESVALIEAHLADCERCSAELNAIKAAIRLPEADVANNYDEAAAIKEIAVLWRRSKVKSLMMGLLAAVLLFGGYVALSQWEMVKVPADIIKIYEVSRLSDGRIVYHAKFTDGYEVNRIRYDTDEKGNFYLTPLRPVIKTKVLSERLSEMYESLEHEQYLYKEKHGSEMKAVYFRTSDEDILIWKQGMALPPASEKVETELRPE